MRNSLLIALGLVFLLLGFNAYNDAKPTPKAPIYQEIKKYSPYYLEKRVGGLEILSKNDKEFKEKPDNMQVFHRLEVLEKEWGKKHLRVENGNLVVFDENKTIATIPINTSKDREFLKSFYGI